MKLTAKTFATVRLDAGKTDQIFFDDEIPGFGLRVRAGGSRNWVFQYSLGEKQRRMSLGRATAESFKSSKGKDGTPNLGIRDRVMQMSLDVKHGKDPQGEKVESRSRASDTFQIVAAEYLKAKKAETRPGCQSACKFDPSSASNFDPFPRRGLLVALVSSELAGIAEARRARVA
jgi:hypothetical protein